MAFTGHLAVITGGGSGMGQAWARQLANEGANRRHSRCEQRGNGRYCFGL